MTNYRKAVTTTGRLSSGTSNLQKTPSASFSVIKHAVARQFELMKADRLFRVDLSATSSEVLLVKYATNGVETLSSKQRVAATGDILWEAYLAAFPEGTNPIYRERTDHDCSCCRHFIRTMGGVVAIIDGELTTIWDGERTGTFYDTVRERMAELVRSAVIDNIFLHTESSVGVEKTFQQLVAGTKLSETVTQFEKGGVLTWEHFHLHLPNAAVQRKDTIGSALAETRAAHDVLKRGLEELTLDSVDTVLELIAQNSLYRGEEHKFVLTEFRKLKVAYGVENAERPSGVDVGASVLKAADKMYGMLGSRDVELDRARDLFVWDRSVALPPAVVRIRNSAIGTLLIDLSADVDLTEAVRKFETSVMAPANYKRPTALVTKAMIEKARAKVEGLGYTSALERRYAHIDDITINNVLFADRTATKLHKDAFDALSAQVAENPRSYDRVTEVPIEKFLAEVMPKARSLELLVENCHVSNLVSLIAPVDPGAKGMFKWPNNFSWSYNGEVTDSIKERVKRAGGSVVGDLCCRLAWDYTDDLDFHMQEPGAPRLLGGWLSAQGNHIYYGNVRQLSVNGGMLDLDANGCDGMKPEPAENIFYADKCTMAEGVYALSVHNYRRRDGGNGFEVEVEVGGATHSFVYDKPLRTTETVHVANIHYSRDAGFRVEALIPSTQTSKAVWGLHTQTFQKVNVVMLSPNYWGGAHVERDATNSDIARSLGDFGVGNKHYFFMLEGCRNEGRARGFFNEFLSAELEPHRKTMEMVGAKMRTEEAERQLSGLGFSSTQRASVLCRVKGSVDRVVKVVF
jgi:hypothetical protein